MSFGAVSDAEPVISVAMMRVMIIRFTIFQDIDI